MTCHNCGAEMERHAFVFVCSYCKSIISINDGEDTLASNDIYTSVCDSHFYTYIQKKTDEKPAFQNYFTLLLEAEVCTDTQHNRI